MPLCTTTMSPLQSRCGWAFSSVGRPCVAQRVWPMPKDAVHRVHADGLFQVAQFALGAADGQLLVVAVDRQARGIVAPVFQALQAFENNRNGAMSTDVADDSAHNFSIIGGVRIGGRLRQGARAELPQSTDFDAVLFDHRIGQHFVGDGFDVRLGLLRGWCRRPARSRRTCPAGPRRWRRSRGRSGRRARSGPAGRVQWTSSVTNTRAFMGNHDYRMAGGVQCMGA